ncbi:hypothetical protein Desde_0826 [Desulfitobacterium dehalogenans ATCC 51507]|uniref:Uncharacterized protein n=1 Tax=Desulfitobacterium dehalogenans (strain ATCC 51507 / DSM 9161 / JW/IU-DC1) TaxID=756499 RepID=I4A5N7_DESDJ|nr:hypothetical protein [Desulfitobacterium dehalogenans]AFL99271.1 hypothetical protein Desde_0826 [Desulfitobacterium dehalogenans ATCC 51507]
MKIEEAYSYDYMDVVDAEKAYELFWEGVIKDKRNFECPAQNCKAQITCSNIDKQIEEMKNTPHFRVYGEHSDECDIYKEIKLAELDVSTEKNKSRTSYLGSETDIFTTERPKNHYHTRKESVKDNDDKHKGIKTSIQTNRDNSLTKRSPEFYSIRPLISKFQRHSKENNLSQRFIKIKGYDVSYKEMFVKIDNNELDKLSKYPRIYFGEATVYRKNNSDFVVRFASSIIDADVKYKPSLYISNEMINSYYWKHKLQTCLNELASNREKQVLVFVYSKPYKKDRFLNFYIDTLDLIDFRYL